TDDAVTQPVKPLTFASPVALGTPAAKPKPRPRPSFLSDDGRFTLFVGYSFLDTDITEGNEFGDSCNDICEGRIGTHGFEISGTYMLNPFVGLTADFSGNFNGPLEKCCGGSETDRIRADSYYILFGPTFVKNVGKVKLHAHALVGIARLWAD